MKLSTLVSPGTWELIERLRPHLDVTIDVLDDALHPLLPEREDPACQALRRLVARVPEGEPSELHERLGQALRTGNSRLLYAGGFRIGLFPIRHDRTSVGLLVAAAPIPFPADAARLDAESGVDERGCESQEPGSRSRFAAGRTARLSDDASAKGEVPDDVVSRRVERLGWSLRATIEADIETRERLGDEQQRSRWLSATLRFLEHLHACESDAELGEALVQAAAIWGDVDARLYRRALDGGFVLQTALPAVAADATPRWLPGIMADGHAGSARVTSIVELEGLGWHGTHTEVLFIPVSTGGPIEWLVAVAGVVDAQFERVLGVAARTMAVRCEQLAARRKDALRRRLTGQLVAGPATAVAESTVPAQAARLLGELARAVGATHARLLAAGAAGGPPRLLAAVGGSAVAREPLPAPRPGDYTLRSPTRLVLPLAAGLPSPALLDLGTVDAEPFDATSATLAETGGQTIGLWLSGALQGLVERSVVRG